MARIEDEKKKLYTPYTPSQNQDNYVEAKPATTAQPTTTFKPSANVDAAQKFLQSVKDNGYNQQWSKQLDTLVNEYMGRGPFQYDQNEDVMWQQAKKTGLDAANLAMRDTTAQAAALSGGYGNSYAATVGQQVYNEGVADIMAMAPEYYQAAYQRYKDEGDTMLQNIGLVQSMDDAAYARYVDALNRAQSDYDTLYGREYGEFLDKRNFDYQLGRDTVADQRYETEWDYNVGRDQIADDRYKTEWEHQLEREGIEDQRYADEFAYQKERDSVADSKYWAEYNYQLDRDAVEDARYDAELGYRAERDKIEDGRYQTEQDYKALKEQYDALVDENEEDETKTAAYEKVLSSPKYASASRALKQTLEGPYKNEAERTNAASDKLYTMWLNGDFGNGEEALIYVEALADELGLDYMDVLGRE
jgi:hypothetical protein